jgi:hypothetical protein
MTGPARRIATTLLALSALTLVGRAGAHPAPPDSEARPRLRQLETPGLAGLRAGAPATRGELGSDARERLRQAERAAPELADLRAGASNNDLLLVITIAVVIIALVVIL